MTKIILGNILITISLIITILLWLIFQFIPDEFPLLFFIQLNQIAALLGTLLLSWSMLLATRLNFLEKLFEGMNGVYKSHKKVSIWGMILIIIHVISLAIQKFPGVNKAISMFFPIHNQAFINIGSWSFWLFILFVATTLLMKKIKLPYHIWKLSHKVTGVALILAFVHIVLIPGITSLSVLSVWIMFTTGTGIASWIYFEFLYKLLSPSYIYQILEINKNDDVFKMKLIPQNNKMLYKPGQYAYLSFIKKNISKEMHPFTITSHPDENQLTFAIKILGDYTATLNRLKIGDIARIWGPYGNFANKFLLSKKDVIFIGGGIGIAPFTSMIKEEMKKSINNRKISLFYCTKYKHEACFDKELASNTKNNFNISYVNKCSRENDRLVISEILDKIRDIKNILVFICGPKRMIKSLEIELIIQGLSKNNIISENFNLL